VVSCSDAQRSVSLGATSSKARIWLTTLSAVDAAFAPRRQVADQPSDPATPVWLFIYEGDFPIARLHVADASNPCDSGRLVHLPVHVARVGIADHPADNAGSRTVNGVLIVGLLVLGRGRAGAADDPVTLSAAHAITAALADPVWTCDEIGAGRLLHWKLSATPEQNPRPGE
jgi:hypothetical protein